MTNAHTETREPPPYLFAALTALVVLLIYVATLAPTTAFWDTSEYIAAAYVLGIPHPPGNPLFVVLAHTFGALPLSESYAARINLFAALTSALSAGLWFLVADRWMRVVVPVRWARLAALIFKCPATSMNVQHWLDDDEDASDDEYEGVSCPACLRLHFVNRKTAKILGQDQE